MPNNDMGKEDNITNKTFEQAARVMGQTAEDGKKNARELLEKVLSTNAQSEDKNWKP